MRWQKVICYRFVDISDMSWSTGLRIPVKILDQEVSGMQSIRTDQFIRLVLLSVKMVLLER